MAAGCKVCGTIYCTSYKARGEEAARLGVRSGTLVARACPNEAKHEGVLRAKAALSRMVAESSVERRRGLDILSLEELSSNIQSARARLREKWKREKGFVRAVYTGELKEDL